MFVVTRASCQQGKGLPSSELQLEKIEMHCQRENVLGTGILLPGLLEVNLRKILEQVGKLRRNRVPCFADKNY
jgi:hypothetical protein